jgi:hypothetical protein
VDYANKIYTLVKNAIGTTLLKDSSQTFTNTPTAFPFMFFDQKDNPTTADDLDNNENAVNATIEITIYTNDTSKLTTAKKIHAIADTQMRSMGFRRTFGPQQITNIADTSICRLIARYTRIIGSGDIF